MDSCRGAPRRRVVRIRRRVASTPWSRCNRQRQSPRCRSGRMSHVKHRPQRLTLACVPPTRRAHSAQGCGHAYPGKSGPALMADRPTGSRVSRETAVAEARASLRPTGASCASGVRPEPRSARKARINAHPRAPRAVACFTWNTDPSSQQDGSVGSGCVAVDRQEAVHAIARRAGLVRSCPHERPRDRTAPLRAEHPPLAVHAARSATPCRQLGIRGPEGDEVPSRELRRRSTRTSRLHEA